MDHYVQTLALSDICKKEKVFPMEALLTGLVPDEWLPNLLLDVWPETNFPMQYAGTDTYVRLFERAGCGQGGIKGGVIYRGTCTSKTKEGRGLSWTRDLERARYHAHSCDDWPKRGREMEPTIWCAEITPEGVLAEIDYEVVVNPRRLRKLRIFAQEDQVPSPDLPWWPSDEASSDALEP